MKTHTQGNRIECLHACFFPRSNGLSTPPHSIWIDLIPNELFTWINIIWAWIWLFTDYSGPCKRGYCRILLAFFFQTLRSPLLNLWVDFCSPDWFSEEWELLCGKLKFFRTPGLKDLEETSSFCLLLNVGATTSAYRSGSFKKKKNTKLKWCSSWFFF